MDLTILTRGPTKLLRGGASPDLVSIPVLEPLLVFLSHVNVVPTGFQEQRLTFLVTGLGFQKIYIYILKLIESKHFDQDSKRILDSRIMK